VIIRSRKYDEIDRCVGLLADVHTVDGYPLHWPAGPRNWLTPASLLTAWVAAHEDVLVGHVALCSAVGDTAAPVWSAACDLPPEHIAAIAKLFVAPSARGRGLGAPLLTQACGEARSRRLRPALEVLDHDGGAIALYERMRWRRIATAPAPWAQASDTPVLLHYYIAPE